MEKVLNNDEKLKVSQYNLIIDRLKELEDLVQDVGISNETLYENYEHTKIFNNLVNLEDKMTEKINDILYPAYNKYELVVELKDDLSKDEREKIINRLKSVINDTDSEIVKFENIGKKVLPYEYKGYDRAYYYVINYEFIGNNIEDINSKITKIERFVRITDEILKFINIKVDD